jgi:hypothetical protein
VLSEHIPSFYVRLGIGLDADERAIKRAYARLLKTLDPELQAAEFEKLRSDYEQALEYAKNPDQDYYFDEGEFVFKEPVNANPAIDSPSFSVQAVNVDAQSASNLEIANLEVKKDIDQDVSHKVVKLLVGSGYEEASLEFQEFCALVSNTNISKLTNTELAELLRTFLQREALTSFEARTLFENLLIEAFAKRRFDQNSGRLLISSAAFFNWNTADSRRLTECGAAGHEVLHLLDNFFGLTDVAQLQLIRFTEKPSPDFSYIAVSKFEEYKLFSKKLFAYFVDEQQEKYWLQAKKKAPFSTRLQHKYQVGRSKIGKIRDVDGRLIFFGIWIVCQFIYQFNKK